METLYVFVARLVWPGASVKHTNRATERSTTAGSFAAAGVALARRCAFTLVEVSVSLTVLALVATSTVWGLSQANFSAASNRVLTCAETIVQNEIDKFLSAEPYSPRHVFDDGTPYPRTTTPLIPAELGTSTTSLPVPFYTDPNDVNVVVTGTLTREVALVALTQTTNGKTDSLDVRRLNVTLAYTFRGRAYQVALSTVRVSDF